MHILFILILISFFTSCTSAHHNQLHYISFNNLKESLPDKTISVGFDIDDTILYSSACYGKYFFHPDGNINQQTIKLSSKKAAEFWHNFEIDCNHEMKLSFPKETGFQLIELHKKRGDIIHFITARQKTDTAMIKQYISNIFQISDVNLHFCGTYEPIADFTHDKASLLKKYNISVYYGNGDNDMSRAIEAHARPIRILSMDHYIPEEIGLRNTPIPYIGKFNEEILEDSWK